MDKAYDVIVIGAGQGGGPLAVACAQKGKKTLLIEKDRVGGTCINRGCTPTKSMVGSAKNAYGLRHCEQFGIDGKFISSNLSKVYARKEEIVTSFRNSSQKSLEAAEGLELVFGHGSFLSPTQIQVRGVDSFVAMSALTVINTGCHPFIPFIEGIQKTPFLDSTSIMELQTLPEHLMIIGGGYISLEFAQMFRRFGSRVTIIERSERLWMREDVDISENLKDILEVEGIDFHFNTTVKKVKKKAEKEIIVTLVTQNNEKTLVSSHLLIATGRSPNTKSLELDHAHILCDDRGFIKVDDRLQTSTSNVFAMGDVKGGPMFTHISYDDFRILRDNLLEGGTRTTKERLTPYTVFTDPQLGRVGMSENEAKKKMIPYKIAKMPMAHVARAVEVGETRGMMKAVIHAKTNQILGCAVLGVEGGEIMSLIQLAMMAHIPCKELREQIFAHPTYAESLNNLFKTCT